ncbi:MAG: DUF2142 domain-containing protein [Streptococcaceae bacterium]|nr:DUF2142 domain-containing protein [Streptococcaceae bacterium]
MSRQKFRSYSGFKRLKPEQYFCIVVLFFGLFASILTLPYTTGDEGYHLSKAYNLFSSQKPKLMDEATLREIELKAINDTSNFDAREIFEKKLDLGNDQIKINSGNESASIIPIDLMHLPAALGVLLARVIYPSYGVMLLFARLFNVLFFTICFYFVIKHSQIGKWQLFMLFTVPFLQKIASPSYDIFCFVALAAFVLHIFKLSKIDTIQKLNTSQIVYTIFTIILLLFCKKNYIFALPLILGLPFIYLPIINFYRKLRFPIKVVHSIVVLFFLMVMIYLFNSKFNLLNFVETFYNSYFNVETIGRRTRQMWYFVPTILPSIFNLVWLLILFLIIITDKCRYWSRGVIVAGICTFFVNWIGIFGGFYQINPNVKVIGELSGRYLHPFLILLIPYLQNFGAKYSLNLPEATVRRLAVVSTNIILVSYLFLVFYRGFILKICPTWTNMG